MGVRTRRALNPATDIMASYRLGASGEEVRRIQQQLQALALYRGPLDGAFGAGTAAAVKAFQQRGELEADGIVGPATWRALFGAPMAKSALLAKPLAHRCLALTGAFETNCAFPECFAALSGDFDGQGISFGVCQWNFGQNTLQPLLKEMIKRHPKVLQAAFQGRCEELVAALGADKDTQMKFAVGIQQQHAVGQPWRGMFEQLGRTDEFQFIQRNHARPLYQAALKLCAEYGLRSQRAKALMFDIKVQNGGIDTHVRTRILADFDSLPAGLRGGRLELAKMEIIAHRRAEAAKPQWIADVRARKLCIARGAGVVHGIAYRLDEQFGITLTR